MSKPIAIALGLSLGLTACAPATPPSPALAPLFAEEIRAGQADIGEDFFGFFALRDVRSDADTLITEWSVNTELEANFDADPAAFADEFRSIFFDGICEEPAFGQIIANGGTIAHAFLGASGRALTTISTSDCGT